MGGSGLVWRWGKGIGWDGVWVIVGGEDGAGLMVIAKALKFPR